MQFEENVKLIFTKGYDLQAGCGSPDLSNVQNGIQN